MLVLGITVSPACIQQVPGTISPKTSGLFPSTPQGQGMEQRFRCHASAPRCAGQAIPAGQSRAWCPRPGAWPA